MSAPSLRLDFSEAEVRELAEAAGAGLPELLKDCEAALALRLDLAGCFRLQGAVNILRRQRAKG